jgi:predicted PurR-regulated permease PerM
MLLTSFGFPHVTTEFSVPQTTYTPVGEAFIRMSLLTIMGISCFLLLRPFLHLILTGMIVAVAIYPGYQKLTKVLHGRKNLAAVLCTLLLMSVTLLPAVLLAGTLVGGVRSISRQLEAGQLHIPPPPPLLDKVPILGAKLKGFWNLCSTDVSAAVERVAPEIRKYLPGLVSASVGIGGALLQFFLAILLAGFLLATSARSIRSADRVFGRIFDDRGLEFEQLVTGTIRSVTNGILGVAVIQSVLASLGFWMVGLPGAGLWAVMFLIASVIQVGPIVLIPAVLYSFATHSTNHAVIFMIWCILVGLSDNVLKPIFLGRGTKVPIAVIFLGVLGGFITMHILGLFVGAIVLSVGYKLLSAWLDAGIPSIQSSHVTASKAA